MQKSILLLICLLSLSTVHAQTPSTTDSFAVLKSKMTDDITDLLMSDAALSKLTAHADFDSTITFIGLIDESGHLVEHLSFGDSAASTLEPRISEVLKPFEFVRTEGSSKFASRRIMMTIQPIGKYKFAVSLQ